MRACMIHNRENRFSIHRCVWDIHVTYLYFLTIILVKHPISSTEHLSLFLQKMCLDGGFRRGKEGRVHFSFLNYRHYEMSFKKLTY